MIRKLGLTRTPKKVMINIYIFLLGGSRGRRHKNLHWSPLMTNLGQCQLAISYDDEWQLTWQWTNASFLNDCGPTGNQEGLTSGRFGGPSPAVWSSSARSALPRNSRGQIPMCSACFLSRRRLAIIYRFHRAAGPQSRAVRITEFGYFYFSRGWGH